jgi:hypothetical protein
MDYQTIVTTEFIPRCMAALNGIRDSLIAAGLAPNRVTVDMPDTEDLRFRIVATRGARGFTGYIELTAAFRSGGPRSDVLFTFWLEGNGVELTSSYVPGPTVHQTSDAGLTALLAKLAQLEATVPEAAVKIRAFLGL